MPRCSGFDLDEEEHSDNCRCHVVVGKENGVPEEVSDYLVYFARMIDKQNVPEILSLYEHAFPDLTERFFRDSMWPDASVVERIVGPGNKIFIILYKELFYRNVHAPNTRKPLLSHRYESFENYQELFSELLTTGIPIALKLPNLWLWDMIDEFVYQFQSYQFYKSDPWRRRANEEEEFKKFEENQSMWNVYTVLNILYLLTSKAQVSQQLEASKGNWNLKSVVDKFGKSDLYFKLGNFALIGLLRIHVLLGDYHQALKTVQYVDLDSESIFNTVPTCLVTLHYFVGFSHLMMRNYGEATKHFVDCLLFIQRTKIVQSLQPMKKIFQYDMLPKAWDQLFPLLAISLSIQPQRIEESIQLQLNERYGQIMMNMANGKIGEFEKAFSFGCPKFLCPNTVVYEGVNQARDPSIRQTQAFLEGIKSRMVLPLLRGYLNLYPTLPTKKLALLMDFDEEDYDSFLGNLLTYKMVVNGLGKEIGPSGNDEEEPQTDIDFYVDRDMINVADNKVARNVNQNYLRYIKKLQEAQDALQGLDIKQ